MEGVLVGGRWGGVGEGRGCGVRDGECGEVSVLGSVRLSLEV